MPATAETLQFESGTAQKTMIELYTSQGCSSCPPAEEFLNTFKTNSQLWDKYIPMAFHVDYWDYIGWKDRFASPLHQRRQQAYARFHGMSTIYTPGFFVNGKEWRRGFFNRRLPEANNKTGNLKVKINNKEVSIEYLPDTVIKKPVQFNIALLGMGLATHIKAGEREGRHTQHEFVVLGWERSNFITGNNKFSWRVRLPDNNKVKAKNHAVVVWINKADSPVPLQAAGHFLP